MDWMFNGASSLTSLDLSGFNTSNVTNMLGMFSLASTLSSLTLGYNFQFVNNPVLSAVPTTPPHNGLWINNRTSQTATSNELWQLASGALEGTWTWQTPGTDPGPTPTGSGTEADPYIITTIDHLRYLADYADTTGTHWHLGANIGNAATPVNFMIVQPFRGVLDGNGFNIHLDINETSQPLVGLFAQIGTSATTGTVGNLSLSGLVSAQRMAGEGIGSEWIAAALAGENFGRIENVGSSVDVSNDGSQIPIEVGGLLGWNRTTGIVIGSYSTGNITNALPNSSVAGLVMSNHGTISYSFTTGVILSVGASYAGGLAGHNIGLIYRSFSSSEVMSGRSAGGLVSSFTGVGTISDSFATGNVSAGINAGGVFAEARQQGTRIFATGNVITSGASSATVGASGIGISSSPPEASSAIAFNANIESSNSVGLAFQYRIAAWQAVELTNNRAFGGIRVNGAEFTGDRTDPNGPHGLDVSMAELNTIEFWRDVMGFDPAVWNFRLAGDGYAEYELPILRNMPAAAAAHQNPVVPEAIRGWTP
jgi:surface protein